jgi:2-dehydropantoate 2-reductase
MPKPGQYRRTSAGGFLVGTLQGHTDQQLISVIRLLEGVGPVRRTENLRGARLSKLTINCAISALGTIGGTTLGRLLVQRTMRELGLALMREAVAVSNASGVQLEPIAKVRLERLVAHHPSTRRLSVAAQHALLLAVGSRYRKLRSSMLAAMERGRTPAVDFINGEIVRLGTRTGIPTPFNQAATETVWAIYRGDLTPGHQALSYFNHRARALRA